MHVCIYIYISVYVVFLPCLRFVFGVWFSFLVCLLIPSLTEDRKPEGATALHLLAGRPLPGDRGKQLFRAVLAKAVSNLPFCHI